MKAIVFPARGEVAFVDRPDPRPGPGEALVEVRASGICHTDLEVLAANYGPGAFPVVPGHEYAGVVVELGPDTPGPSVGTRVVVDPNIECGRCRACGRGQAHLCEALRAYGVTQDGGFAERSVVRASGLHAIGDIPFHVAALAEPMGCVLNGVDAVADSSVQSALIFGAGPMGLLMAIALKGRGVREVAVCDIDEARLDLAESFDLQTVASQSADLDRFRHGTDLAVDATGVPSVAAGLTGYAASGGKVLFFGVCPSEARIEISPFEVFRRQLTLTGSHSLNHNIPVALAALDGYGPDIGRLVSHRLPLPEVAAILAGKTPRGSLKVQALVS
ncbi:MAG: alcohol dehydrogenase catalytic domain-containing protein [Pseudomonadota bacterium]